MTPLIVIGGLSVATLAVSLGVVFGPEVSWWLDDQRRARHARKRRGMLR